MKKIINKNGGLFSFIGMVVVIIILIALYLKFFKN